VRESISNPIRRDPDNSVNRKLWPYLLAGGVFIFAVVTAGSSGLIIIPILLVIGAILQRDQLQAAVRWHPPQLETERTLYPLGSLPTVIYHRKFRNKVIDLSSCRINCRLVCEERATYRQGSSTRTDTEIVFDRDFEATAEGTSDGLIAQVPIEIPAFAGAPSFDLGSNKVHWFLETTLRGAKAAPRDTNVFVIDVGPVIDDRFRPQVQDS